MRGRDCLVEAVVEVVVQLAEAVVEPTRAAAEPAEAVVEAACEIAGAIVAASRATMDLSWDSRVTAEMARWRWAVAAGTPVICADDEMNLSDLRALARPKDAAAGCWLWHVRADSTRGRPAQCF